MSFTGENYAGPIYGWMDVNLTLPIRSGKDVKAVEDFIKTQNGLRAVTVLNFRRFDTE